MKLTQLACALACGCALVFTPAVAETGTTSAAIERQAEDANATLDELMAAYWDAEAAASPLGANLYGYMKYTDRLGKVGDAARMARRTRLEATLDALDDLRRADLTPLNQTNYDVFGWTLRNELSVIDLPTRYFTFNAFSGWTSGLQSAIKRLQLRTREDHDNYIKRLNDVGRYAEDMTGLMRQAITAGWVHPCESIEGQDEIIRSAISGSPEESFAWEPVKELPESVLADARAIREGVRTAIAEVVNPALTDYLEFYTSEYAPACRATHGIVHLPRGDAAYAEWVKYFATVPDATPDAVHETGLREVARIRAEMEAIRQEVGFDGDLEAFFGFMRSDPQFKPQSRDGYMAAAAVIAKRIDAALPRYFATLPRNPFTITPIPDAQAPTTAIAFYSPGSLENGVAGQYFLNLHDLESKSLAELPALTLHEAAPGHHQQISIAQELGELPLFRRFSYISAFGEGWALYTEYLGEEMGIYTSPYERFGRLSFEMWRALRLVVDTGLHAKGWTRQQAIDYMAQNSSLSLANITNEVDRYITWPGQAISYKIGELKIKELRAEAEAELGEDFDLRTFHSHLLSAGAIPLEVLEARMDAWVEDQKAE